MKFVLGFIIVFITANVLAFQCPRGVGNFPHENHCDQYFSCIAYMPILRGCRKGNIYDNNLKRCVRARGNPCWLTSDKAALTIGGLQSKTAPMLQSSCNSVTETETFQPTVFTTLYTSTTDTTVRITEFQTQTTTVHIAATTTTTVEFTSTVYS